MPTIQAVAPGDGLSLHDALISWSDISAALFMHKGFLSVPNFIYDAVMPIIPQSDLAVFMYLYRRIMGYPDDAATVPTAVVPYEHFANGRKTREGRPIDFGCGLAVSSIQESLERLIAAKMVVQVKRGKGGRFAEGSTWTIGDGREWNFTPFYAGMTYGKLGRYVQAARWGRLAPPRTVKEARTLEQAIKDRLQNIQNVTEIYLPEDWFALPSLPATGNEGSDSIVPLTGNTILPLTGKTSYRSPVREEGTFPHSSRENQPSKDTKRKTLPKDTSFIIADAPAEHRSDEGQETSLKKKVGGVEPSFDGRMANEWRDAFVEHCYNGNVPGEWALHTGALKELRVRYPLEVVLDYYDYWKGKPGMADRTAMPRWIARDIVSWPGLEEAQDSWRRRQQERGNDGKATEPRGDSGTGAVGPTRPRTPEEIARRARLQARVDAMARGEYGPLPTMPGGGAHRPPADAAPVGST